LKICILDEQGKNLSQMISWLVESERVSGVEAYGDYLQFIDHVRASKPDLCMIRLGMADIPGLKTADAIKRENSEARVVFMADDEAYAVAAFEVGAYGYLLWPVNKQDLDKYIADFY
jgi:DNA-binding NarL/FixJ family response regulator